MRRLSVYLTGLAALSGCGAPPPRVAEGTFVATLTDTTEVTVQGRATWHTRRQPVRTAPGQEYFITLSSGNGAGLDTTLLLYRESQPFRRGSYAVDGFYGEDPVAQVIVRSGRGLLHGWNSTEGTLAITRSENDVIEGEFRYSAAPVRGGSAPITAQGRFSAVRRDPAFPSEPVPAGEPPPATDGGPE